MRTLHLLLLWPVALTIAIPLAYPQSPTPKAAEQFPEDTKPEGQAESAAGFLGGVLVGTKLPSIRNWRAPRLRNPLRGSWIGGGLRNVKDSLATFRREASTFVKNKLPGSRRESKPTPGNRRKPRIQTKADRTTAGLYLMDDDMYMQSLDDKDFASLQACMQYRVSKGDGSRTLVE